MPRGNVKKKDIEPVGPFAPPLPKTAENDEGEPEPMAVANDKRTSEDAFMPTTQRDVGEPMNHELARDYQVSRSGEEALQESFRVGGRTSDEETKAQQHPRGYKDADAPGFKELKDSQEG